MIYSLFVFDRHCQCIYFQDWVRRLQSTANGHIAAAPGAGAPLSPAATTTSQNSGARTSILSTISSAALFSPAGNATTASGNAADISQLGSNPGNGLPVEEEAKLVYGVTFSLRNLLSKLSPSPGGGNYFAYKTSVYKLHQLTTPSCLRFVLITDPEAGDCRDILHNLYARCYVEYVVKNPLARPGTDWMGETGVGDVEKENGEPYKQDEYLVANEYFRSVVNKYIRSLPLYSS